MSFDNTRGRALVALGANIPHAGLEGAALLAAAITEISARGLAVRAISSPWRTGAWPPSDQPDFVNAAIAADAGDLSPDAVYGVLRGVEQAFGRERRERWGPRTIDLDLIDLGGLQGEWSGVQIPHPRAHERLFVLAPLAEVAPDWRHPVLGRTAAELLAALAGGQTAERLPPFDRDSLGDLALRIAKRAGSD